MNPALTIAVVDADEAFRSDLIRFLKSEGFSVWGAESAEAFYRKLVATNADVVMADLILPAESGLSLIAYLGDVGRFQLVALAEAPTMDDQFASLEAGACLFFAKNSRRQLLLASLRALLPEPLLPHAERPRRTADKPDAHWTLSEDNASLLSPAAIDIKLTVRESKLLAALLATPGKGVMKPQLLAALGFRDDALAYDRVEVVLAGLRRKVEKQTDLTLPIRSLFGKGLMFVAQGERRG